MKQNRLIMIVAIAAAAAAAGTAWLQNIEYAQSTSKLIDTSTGERISYDWPIIVGVLTSTASLTVRWKFE
ncbi:MAG: hypothetical protein ACRD5E_06105 [Nitrososphaeraceae archaeon]